MDAEKDVLLGYGPQGLALEVNPWQSQRSVESVLLYRGTIVSAWANVEATLIEVALRASHQAEYRGFRPQYPSKLKSRVTYLREIIELPGPLQPYRNMARCVLDRYVRTEALRNMMAHGGMQILPGWGATMKMFKPLSGSEVSWTTQRFTESELRSLAFKTARFSRSVQRLLGKLNTLNALPNLNDIADDQVKQAT